MRAVLACVFWVGALSAAEPAGTRWVSLFNGRDLSGWQTWLGTPDKSVDGLATPRKPNGDYAASVGHDDPKHVFSVVQADGVPALRISGEIFGAITSEAEYGDFHVKLEFKWGERKWPPREKAVRDSGLLYYAVGPDGATSNKAWMRSIECQVQEHDVGDFWTIDGTTVELEGEKSENGDVVYKKGAPRIRVGKDPRRAIKGFDNEKPSGEWNTLEVVCLRGTCVHAVNGKVNMVLSDPRETLADGLTRPLTRGRFQIQSEGAEVFYRNIMVTPVTEFPAAYKP
jgi:hypothetical protein